MKKINYFIGIISLMAVLLMASCSGVLDETPRATFEPGYFKTEQGVRHGLTSLYAHTRYIYGGYWHAFVQSATDESTYGQSGDNNQTGVDLSLSTAGGTQFGSGVTSSSCRSDVIWNNTFTYINTANGIIEDGGSLGLNPELIAEAYFWRAWDYFMLVQTFGGVPLDLGSGELMPNATTSRYSKRNTVPEVYTKCVFPDLIKAVNDLPSTPRAIGAVTKTVARLYLAKAYLTYGWWLENPENIPTHPAADRTDPNGHNAAWYFQQAYDVADYAIEHPGNYGLMPTFYETHLMTNDRNKEFLLYADHDYDTQYGGFEDNNNSSVGGYRNADNWLVTWNYTTIAANTSIQVQQRTSTGDLVFNDDGTPKMVAQPSPVQREASQALGRPWTRTCPTIGALTQTFADKTNDSRYDGTFVTTYFGNWEKNSASKGYPSVFAANGLEVAKGGAILKFLPEQPAPGTVTYPTTNAGSSAVGAGSMAGESAWVLGPEDINRIIYPGQWKNGPGRSDYDFSSSLGSPNSSSPRPRGIAKFSELYLIAAEAAVKNNDNVNALKNINVLRRRAGMWKFSLAENQEKIADYSAAMVAATPPTITIDYVLAERSRELYGEGHRWYDLVRTQTWIQKSQKYTIGGGWDNVKAVWQNHTPVEITRAIEIKHYLRPIPQTQIDRMEMTDAEKVQYQNPGY